MSTQDGHDDLRDEPDGPVRVADFDALDDGDAGTAVRVASFDADEDQALHDDGDPGGDRPGGPDRDGGGPHPRSGGADDGLRDTTAPRVRPADLDGIEDAEAPSARVVALDGTTEPGVDTPARQARFDGRPVSTGSRRRGPAAPDRPEGARRRGGGRTGADRSGGGGRQGGPADAAGRSGADGPLDLRGTTGGDEAGTGSARRGRGGPRGRAGSSPRVATTPAEDESRAKEICLRLLTDRARTVKELRDALLRKEVPDDVADRVLERFDEVGLVDDEAFAGQWVRSRHRHRGLGKRAIAQELRRKGVAKEIADEALSEIDPESEEARARELVDRKLRTLKVGTKDERATAARRLVGMLARKGYGGGVAYSVVREAIAARGAEEDELGDGPVDD